MLNSRIRPLYVPMYQVICMWLSAKSDIVAKTHVNITILREVELPSHGGHSFGLCGFFDWTLYDISSDHGVIEGKLYTTFYKTEFYSSVFFNLKIISN